MDINTQQQELIGTMQDEDTKLTELEVEKRLSQNMDDLSEDRKVQDQKQSVEIENWQRDEYKRLSGDVYTPDRQKVYNTVRSPYDYPQASGDQVDYDYQSEAMYSTPYRDSDFGTPNRSRTERLSLSGVNSAQKECRGGIDGSLEWQSRSSSERISANQRRLSSERINDNQRTYSSERINDSQRTYSSERIKDSPKMYSSERIKDSPKTYSSERIKDSQRRLSSERFNDNQMLSFNELPKQYEAEDQRNNKLQTSERPDDRPARDYEVQRKNKDKNYADLQNEVRDRVYQETKRVLEDRRGRLEQEYAEEVAAREHGRIVDTERVLEGQRARLEQDYAVELAAKEHGRSVDTAKEYGRSVDTEIVTEDRQARLEQDYAAELPAREHGRSVDKERVSEDQRARLEQDYAAELAAREHVRNIEKERVLEDRRARLEQDYAAELAAREHVRSIEKERVLEDRRARLEQDYAAELAAREKGRSVDKERVNQPRHVSRQARAADIYNRTLAWAERHDEFSPLVPDPISVSLCYHYSVCSTFIIFYIIFKDNMSQSSKHFQDVEMSHKINIFVQIYKKLNLYLSDQFKHFNLKGYPIKIPLRN